MNSKLPILLIVEDDEGLRSQLKWAFDEYEVVLAGDRPSAVEAVERYQPSVVTLDLGLPPDPDNASEGLAALSDILLKSPGTKIIVVTGNDDRSVAVESVARGAYDFCEKPIDLELLKLILGRALRLAGLERENRELKKARSDKQSAIKGASQQLSSVLHTVDKVADSDLSILILGESGTGKELIAGALHSQSGRAEGPFVAINCASIPNELLESELFGYEKGAFTGATRSTPGKIELANGGTLFLDEIGDMPIGLQAKILRFLQERVIERVGGRQEIAVDVRIVSATHRDINQLIEQELFRQDLYFRIGEIELVVPPVRERVGDAELLAKGFLQQFALEAKKPVTGFTPEAIELIRNYSWPGNVRELKSSVKRGVIMADGALVSEEDLGLRSVSAVVEEEVVDLKQARSLAEKKALETALQRSDFNIASAAKLLGITRPTMYALMDKAGIKKK